MLLVLSVGVAGAATPVEYSIEWSARSHVLMDEIHSSGGDLHARLVERYPTLVAMRDEFLAAAAEGRIGNVRGILNSLGGTFSHDAAMEAQYLRAMRSNQNPDVRDYLRRNDPALSRMRREPAQLELPSLEDGGPMNLDEYRGKPVLVSIWSRHCSGCIGAMPKLNAVLERYRGEFEIFGVCLNRGEENRAVHLELLRKHGATWKNARLEMDNPPAGQDGEFERQLAWFGPPQRASGLYFLLDAQGRLLTTQISGQWLEYEVRKALGLPPLKPGEEAWTPPPDKAR